MRKIIFLWAAVLTVLMAYSQEDTTVHWETFEQVKQAFYKRPKPILIFLYDPQNDSCKMMLKNTFGKSEVARYINFMFYAIKFNVRTDKPITFFSGKTFYHRKGKPYHDLVYVFLQDSVHFPALVMFDRQATGQVFYGYKDRDHIFPILIYYAEDVYKTTSFKDFLPLYFKTYPPGVPQVMTILHIHWIPIDEIDQRMKQNPKKIFIDVYNRYKITPTIMRIQVYNNPIIAQYLNTHFYPTTVEAKWGDTIVFHGYKFGPSSKYPYHTLAIDLLNGHMIFPAFVVFDKKYELIAIRHGFYTPEEFYKFITYIGGDYYKKEKYSQYLKEHKAELDEKIKQIKKYYSHVKY